MGLGLIAAGLLLVVAGARGKQGDLYALLENDFFGSNSFLPWLAAIGVVGGAGYVPALRSFSHAFLALLLIVFVLKNNGVFDNFKAAISSTSANAGTQGTNGLPPLPQIRGSL